MKFCCLLLLLIQLCKIISGVLYVMNLDGDLLCVNRTNGHIIWKTNFLPVTQIWASEKSFKIYPNPRDGTLYVNISSLYKLKVMPFTIPELVQISPLRTKTGVIYIGEKKDYVYKIDAETGQSNLLFDKLFVSPKPTIINLFQSEYRLTAYDSRSMTPLWNITYNVYDLNVNKFSATKRSHDLDSEIDNFGDEKALALFREPAEFPENEDLTGPFYQSSTYYMAEQNDTYIADGTNGKFISLHKNAHINWVKDFKSPIIFAFIASGTTSTTHFHDNKNPQIKNHEFCDSSASEKTKLLAVKEIHPLRFVSAITDDFLNVTDDIVIPLGEVPDEMHKNANKSKKVMDYDLRVAKKHRKHFNWRWDPNPVPALFLSPFYNSLLDHETQHPFSDVLDETFDYHKYKKANFSRQPVNDDKGGNTSKNVSKCLFNYPFAIPCLISHNRSQQLVSHQFTAMNGQNKNTTRMFHHNRLIEDLSGVPNHTTQAPYTDEDEIINTNIRSNISALSNLFKFNITYPVDSTFGNSNITNSIPHQLKEPHNDALLLDATISPSISPIPGFFFLFPIEIVSARDVWLYPILTYTTTLLPSLPSFHFAAHLGQKFVESIRAAEPPVDTQNILVANNDHRPQLTSLKGDLLTTKNSANNKNVQNNVSLMYEPALWMLGTNNSGQIFLQQYTPIKYILQQKNRHFTINRFIILAIATCGIGLFLPLFIVFVFFQQRRRLVIKLFAPILKNIIPFGLFRVQINGMDDKIKSQYLNQNAHGRHPIVCIGKIECDTTNILGYGSMGTVVFRGTYENKRSIAVKRISCMHPHFPETFTLMAHREIANMIKTDRHENVIRYYAAEIMGTGPQTVIYIALELCQLTFQHAALLHTKNNSNCHIKNMDFTSSTNNDDTSIQPWTEPYDIFPHDKYSETNGHPNQNITDPLVTKNQKRTKTLQKNDQRVDDNHPFSNNTKYELWDEIVLKNTNVWDLCHQMLNGLSHLHALKIVHRDLKPQNVLISIQPKKCHTNSIRRNRSDTFSHTKTDKDSFSPPSETTMPNDKNSNSKNDYCEMVSEKNYKIRVVISDFGISKSFENTATSIFTTNHHYFNNNNNNIPSLLKQNLTQENGLTPNALQPVYSPIIRGTLGWIANEIFGANAFYRNKMDENNAVCKPNCHSNSPSTNSEHTPPTSTKDHDSSSNISLSNAYLESLNNEQNAIDPYKSDIFSAGCVMYYVCSRGKHPFAFNGNENAIQRQLNINKNRLRLDAPLMTNNENKSLSDQNIGLCLIQEMLSYDSILRPTVEECMSHCAFWSDEKKLQFILDVSDLIEKADPTTDKFLLQLEKRSHLVFSNQACQIIIHENGERYYDWSRALDVELKKDLRKFRYYRTDTLRDLLRALRNKKHHYKELSPELKDALGVIPSGFLSYFTQRYPFLLLHLYSTFKYMVVMNEPSFYIFPTYMNKYYV